MGVSMVGTTIEKGQQKMRGKPESWVKEVPVVLTPS
jgi:hypothetical protein